MKRIMFQLPLNRFDETDALATRAALRRSLDIKDRDIDTMIDDAKEHRQYMIFFGVTAEQFATFLIYRNELGSRNLFAELKARLLDNEAPIVNHRIVDFVFVGPKYSADGYHIHFDMPPDFVARENDKRAERRAFRSSQEARRAATHIKFDTARAARLYGAKPGFVNSAGWTGHADPLKAADPLSPGHSGTLIHAAFEIERLKTALREARNLLETILAGNWAGHYARIARAWLREHRSV